MGLPTDYARTADAIAYVEADYEASLSLGDPSGQASQIRSVLHEVVVAISEAARADRPRFDVGAFAVRALPLRTARDRAAILKTLGLDTKGECD